MNLDLYIVKPNTSSPTTYLQLVQYNTIIVWYIHGYMPLEHYFIWYTHKLFVLLYLWHWTTVMDKPQWPANWNGITPGNHAMRQN